MKRDYVTNILNILESHGGCLTGFNNLKRIGNFHGNTLAEHLKEMENNFQIEITTINKQVKRYCLFGIDFKKAFKYTDSEIKVVENELKQTDLKGNELFFLIRNHIKLSYHNFIIDTVQYLYAKYEKNDKQLTRDIDRKRMKTWKKIEEMVSLLPLEEKTKLWRFFIKDPPKVISLDEYKKSDKKQDS